MILEQFRLDGKVAVVTGSGTGLGEGMAIGLAEAGADVVGVYNRHAPEAAKSAVEKLGRRFLAVQADLASVEPISRIVETAVTELGRLDILVNDAGIIRRAPSIEYSEKDWDEVMNINLKSLFFLCQAAARQFLKQGSGGKIVNIASLLSFQGGILIPPLHGQQERRAGTDPAAGQRMGQARHQRQRHRSRLHGNGQHRTAAQGSQAGTGDPGADSRRALGCAG